MTEVPITWRDARPSDVASYGRRRVAAREVARRGLSCEDFCAWQCFHVTAGAVDRWDVGRWRGLTDAELANCIRAELGIRGGFCAPVNCGELPGSHRGGADPCIWIGDAFYRGQPIRGRELLDLARRVLGIGYPTGFGAMMQGRLLQVTMVTRPVPMRTRLRLASYVLRAPWRDLSGTKPPWWRQCVVRVRVAVAALVRPRLPCLPSPEPPQCARPTGDEYARLGTWLRWGNAQASRIGWERLKAAFWVAGHPGPESTWN